MQTKRIVVSTHPGITAAVATRLASGIKNMHSVVIVRCGEQMACARNILSVLALCATMGTTLEIQAFGDDEALAAETAGQILTAAGTAAAQLKDP